MSLATEGWIAWGRWRRRRNRHRLRRGGGALRDWIRANAGSRSFADIGCMWGVDGSMAFLAEECGATRVTGFDGMSPTDDFLSEHRRRGSRVRFVQGDFHDPISVDEVGVHDVVLCNGVVYHSPNPYLLLDHLHRITGDLLLLGSHTIPEVPGLPQACVFYPELMARDRSPFARAHPKLSMPGVTDPFDDTAGYGYQNMWWGLTPSALRAMLEVAGFEPLECLETDMPPFFTHFVARRREVEPVIPDPGLIRKEAARAREAGIIPDLSATDAVSSTEHTQQSARQRERALPT
jgi:SAM-dependent methyltransferase